MSDAPERAVGGTVDQRIVVDPSPVWPGRDVWREWSCPSAPRIRVSVDRGEWASYEPGDRIFVYFQVDRPCYVTVLDYTTDGGVEMLFPSRWSASNYASPGVVYRIPDSRGYALRVTGPAGVENIVACAHELPWPGGAPDPWILPGNSRTGNVRPAAPGARGRKGDVVVEPSPTQHGAQHGEVVVEPSRPSHPNRGHGTVIVEPSHPRRYPYPYPSCDWVIVEPRWWPVPPAWHSRPEKWSCDEVSFYVTAGAWFGGSWEHESWHGDPWHDGSRQGGPYLSEQFEMWRCSDEFSSEVRVGDDDARVRIRCTESEDGRPTEIVGIASWSDASESETLFRIDVDGQHGDLPRPGQVFTGVLTGRAGGVRVAIQVLDAEVTSRGSGGHRIEWIRFAVQAALD